MRQCESREVSDQNNGLGPARLGSTSEAAELGRQRRAQEGDLGQPFTQRLCDQRDIDRRSPRSALVVRTSEFQPARCCDSALELVDAFGVVDLADAMHAEALSNLRGGVPEGGLFWR